MDSADRRPFAGIKVLDATRVLAGPYAAYQLGLLGAEVLKIEKPGSGDSVRFRGTDATLADAGLIEALGEPRLLADPRFCDAAGRRAHREELRAAMSRRFAGRDAAQWERLLNQAGLPAARVRSVPEALACAQTRSRGVLQRIDLRPGVAREAGLLLAPFRFAHDGPRIDSAPRPLGADTDAVLRGLGYAEEDIAAMRATAAIG